MRDPQTPYSPVGVHDPPTDLRTLILRCRRFDDCPFIMAPGQAALTYRHFIEHVEHVGTMLGAHGLGHDSRVAVLVPNGPVLATCLLATMANAVCAPIDFDLPDLDTRRVLERLSPEAVIVPPACAARIEALLDGRESRIIVLHATSGSTAGQFQLEPAPHQAAPSSRHPGPDDIAIVCLSSGTTGFPKLVPMTQRGVAHCAVETARWLRLAPSDLGLNVMPMTHGQGLMVGLLPILSGGGSVICGSDMDPDHFLELFEEYRPTWFTASPSFHRALANCARDYPRALCGNRLRFVRAGSAHLSPVLHRELESLFDSPVITAYGTMEVCHVTSNPLPPEERRTGTVGLAYGNRVALMDESGQLLPARSAGEVVVRGPSVTPGYLGSPGANEALFRNGWARTGDLGWFDEDGYLTLLGRVDEQINRGGLSISPLEIEEAILSHPSIIQAAAFSIPHESLGEDVAAAVTTNDPGLTGSSIRAHLRARLTLSKIPREVLILDRFPTTGVGKIKVQELTAMLHDRRAAASEAAPSHPGTWVEVELERIWSHVLERPSVNIHADFFGLGGDSMSAFRIVSRIAEKFGASINIAEVFDTPTIAEQARVIARRLHSSTLKA